MRGMELGDVFCPSSHEHSLEQEVGLGPNWTQFIMPGSVPGTWPSQV